MIDPAPNADLIRAQAVHKVERELLYALAAWATLDAPLTLDGLTQERARRQVIADAVRTLSALRGPREGTTS